MYEFIIGKVKKIKEGYIVLENYGIGYKISTTTRTIERLELDKEYQFYTSFQVREDGIYLYGFLEEMELEMFNLMTTVSGVGPKSALSMLSILNVLEIKQAVISNNISILSKANGIGKKTASRIVLELQDKIATIGGDFEVIMPSKATMNTNVELAIEALQNLGFVRAKVESVMLSIDTEDLAIEDIIGLCLKKLS